MPLTPRRARVLVVDDEKGVRDVLQNILQRQGHHVIPAPDGATAIRLSAANEFDIVFCDLMLPGMSGFAVLSALRKHRRRLPVVVMSGYPTDEVRSGSLLLGAFAFLAKPFELERIHALIARALAGAPPA